MNILLLAIMVYVILMVMYLMIQMEMENILHAPTDIIIAMMLVAMIIGLRDKVLSYRLKMLLYSKIESVMTMVLPYGY